jgi:hypothetical protein
MLIAQAFTEGFTLVSRDDSIALYDVDILKVDGLTGSPTYRNGHATPRVFTRVGCLATVIYVISVIARESGRPVRVVWLECHSS